jgi:signal transduction histidine kinase
MTTVQYKSNRRQPIDSELESAFENAAEIVERKYASDLEQVNEKLKQANRLKDVFLANMSHELRTPLADVLTKAELLRAGYYGSLNERQKKELQKIESGGQHLLRLISDIFDLAQIETGQLKLQYEPVSVWEVCEASLQSILEPARKKGLQVADLEVDQTKVVEADVLRLKQMLEILLNNAIKFTPEGGRIALKAVVLPGGAPPEDVRWVQFAVKDTGIGIALDHLEKIFVPFVQLDEGLARRYVGLGLGLALCNSLARLHKGRCRVKSILGEGSLFIIELPLRRRMKSHEGKPLFKEANDA